MPLCKNWTQAELYESEAYILYNNRSSDYCTILYKSAPKSAITDSTPCLYGVRFIGSGDLRMSCLIWIVTSSVDAKGLLRDYYIGHQPPKACFFCGGTHVAGATRQGSCTMNIQRRRQRWWQVAVLGHPCGTLLAQCSQKRATSPSSYVAL